jgi:MFS family permease
MSSNYAVFLLGMLVAGPLTDEYGARWVWGAAAGVAALSALVGFALARGIDEQMTPGAEPLAATER